MQGLSERLEKLQLNSMEPDEIAELMALLSQPRFRTQQVFAWLAKGVAPAGMTNLPSSLRETLSELPYGSADICAARRSQKDGTVKYLFELCDGNLVEGVLMSYHYGNTLCLSTQVGCRMGCAFCASTLDGCVRDMTAGEMLQCVAEAERANPPQGGGRGITNAVLMGSGEPLDNYDNVVRFLRLVTSPDGFGMSSRNISLSTCGIVDRIDSLADDAPHVTLCISLHAPNDELRSSLMPINKKYPLSEVLAAAARYAERTGRRVIFEYALIRGVNDGIVHVRELASRLKGINCHVNLIPLNRVEERGLDGTPRARAYEIASQLADMRISASVRREMGSDIEGACGQLRRRTAHERLERKP
ncbi:MAG: 23S rRNA (adenine(2503)-C(2))-methyltransferase RlmN [Clostridia bacterium]|nr:23S rRNA (adenine(2503)-C(2))-methyltransferase RlmN [Clostridia bacterium]